MAQGRGFDLDSELEDLVIGLKSRDILHHVHAGTQE
jgi:hypothetical protein